MIKAEDCKNIDEIRIEIDKLDYEIVNLLSKRAEYVKYAANFKTSAESVKAEIRVKEMIEKRKEWAIEQNISPEIIEKIYRNIVELFISDEMKEWNENRKK